MLTVLVVVLLLLFAKNATVRLDAGDTHNIRHLLVKRPVPFLTIVLYCIFIDCNGDLQRYTKHNFIYNRKERTKVSEMKN